MKHRNVFLFAILVLTIIRSRGGLSMAVDKPAGDIQSTTLVASSKTPPLPQRTFSTTSTRKPVAITPPLSTSSKSSSYQLSSSTSVGNFKNQTTTRSQTKHSDTSTTEPSNDNTIVYVTVTIVVVVFVSVLVCVIVWENYLRGKISLLNPRHGEIVENGTRKSPTVKLTFVSGLEVQNDRVYEETDHERTESANDGDQNSVEDVHGDSTQP